MPTENVYWEDSLHARLSKVTEKKVEKGEKNAKGKDVTVRDVIIEATKLGLPQLEEAVGIERT